MARRYHLPRVSLSTTVTVHAPAAPVNGEGPEGVHTARSGGGGEGRIDHGAQGGKGREGQAAKRPSEAAWRLALKPSGASVDSVQRCLASQLQGKTSLKKEWTDFTHLVTAVGGVL